jgi:hypothetical protein
VQGVPDRCSTNTELLGEYSLRGQLMSTPDIAGLKKVVYELPQDLAGSCFPALGLDGRYPK